MDRDQAAAPSELSYRNEYFGRLRVWAFLLEGLSPLALLTFWWLNAHLTETPMAAYGRSVVWAVGSLGCVMLILVLRRVDTLQLHGWLTLALLLLTTCLFVRLATPSHEGGLWMLPAILIAPIVVAPFWIWMHKNILACVLCYGSGAALLLRMDANATTTFGYAVMSLLCTMICVAIFVTIDQTRRIAYQKQRDLYHHAHHDALTGLPSRRRFQELGQQAVEYARKHGAALSLAFIDLDHFKAVNDRFSHAAGDRALELVAQTMVGRMTTDMVAARVGGEEFVLLLPRLGLAAAAEFAESLKAAVAAQDMGGFHVTISSGIAELTLEDDLARLMHRADDALLEAKRAGRNRVVRSPGLHDSEVR